MSDPYVGEIRIFAGNFAPYQWAFCSGQMMSIAQNTALFSILGTYYGGNGQTTFALPNLVGRAPMHPGYGSGLSQRTLGQQLGEAAVTLLTSELPGHTHSLNQATLTPQNQAQNVATPAANTVFGLSAPGQAYTDKTSPLVAMSPLAIAPTGGSQSHENRQPLLGINFIIALYGIYPSRN